MSELLQAPEAVTHFNPLSPEFIRDPYPHYHHLRATDPVHRSPLGFFVATRHADVTHVLRDKRFGKDFVGRMTRRNGPAIWRSRSIAACATGCCSRIRPITPACADWW